MTDFHVVIIWVITPCCSLVGEHKHSKGTYCLHLLGDMPPNTGTHPPFSFLNKLSNSLESYLTNSIEMNP
jgi:hypothetical protein